MPRIICFRLFGLWVAFHLDDYEHAYNIRLGLTERQARNRTVMAI